MDSDIAVGENYLRKHKTGLARSIEYNPNNEKIYIHMGSKSVPLIGKGFQGGITTTLSYEAKPEILARKVYKITGDDLPAGVIAVKKLQGKLGIVELRADSKYIGKDKETKVHCLFKKYNSGSLEKWLQSKETRAFQDKLSIAKDIVTGISEMHAIGFVHRDIKLENILIEKKDDGTLKAVITDLDTVYDLENDKESLTFCHGTKFYTPPFGSIPSKVDRDEYKHIDIYAAGCVIDMLINEKTGAWMCEAAPSRKNRILHSAITTRKSLLEKDVSKYRVAQKIESLILDMLECGLIKKEKEKKI